MNAGVHTIKDIPATKKLRFAAKRQIRAMKEDRLIVEPGLAKALEAFDGKLGFLDFETIARLCRFGRGWLRGNKPPPSSATTGQTTRAATPRRISGGRIPRCAARARARHDRRDRRRRQKVVTYTSFEKTQIRALQRAVPALKSELEALEGKLIDLHR